MIRQLLAFLALAILVQSTTRAGDGDSHSYAEPDQVRVRELFLDLKVDFEHKQLGGFVELGLDWRNPQARELKLDTRDLSIERVQAVSNDGRWRNVAFVLAKADPTLGAKLSLRLSAQDPRVRIHYRTSTTASGLQWLTAQQTAGKQHPFMFSQSQAIHARSWVPLQDTPAVRFTYRARIATPAALRAVMSADNDVATALDGSFHFTMPQAIPSYLMAIAVGDLAVQAIGPRSAVYAEPSVLAAAAKEFEDTEAMIAATEALYGAYRWGRYDLLILPPSFPFGGMENPRLSFITPTVIAGDKSLVDLIAHELAHSWSGNLVTNASWEHIWLNEGFTSYVENRIVERVYGQELADMQSAVSIEGLKKEMAELSAADQRLLVDLKGRDPDEGLTDVPYIKGAWFLTFLEKRFGREVFDPFVRAHFDGHAFQSIVTEDFRGKLVNELMAQHPGKVSAAEVEAWLHEPGIPAFAPPIASARLTKLAALRDAWLAGKVDAAGLDAKRWATVEWQYFFDTLPEQVDAAKLDALDRAYALTGTRNSEIAFRWYLATTRAGMQGARTAMAEHMIRIGRRKLIVPLYEALVKTEEGKLFAQQVYAKAGPGYHPIARETVEKVLAGSKD